VARDRHRAAWEDWGRIDPFWALLPKADACHRRWDVDRSADACPRAASSAPTDSTSRESRLPAALADGLLAGTSPASLAPHACTRTALQR
jgi:hypothetical protein